MGFSFGGTGSGGGGGLVFRDPPDEFTGANLAACRTARDTYFATAAGLLVLPDYQGNPSLAIILNPTNSTDNVFETYTPGQTGMAYDNTQWVERTDAVQGNPGPQERFLVYGYGNFTAAPTTAPTGGTFIQSTDALTLPTGYTAARTTPATGETPYVIQADVNPAVDADTVTLVWSLPVEDPETIADGQAAASATAAAASATAAAASATAASGDAALVTSYSGAVPILENAAFESNNLDVTVPNWRDYDFIQVVARDSNATTQIDRPAPLIPTAGLDTYGESRVPFNNNDELRLESTAGSDVIAVNITGWSGHPTTGDVITFYGIRSGVEAGGGTPGTGGLDEAGS